MNNKTYSGKDLEMALKSGELTQTAPVSLTGMVKPSDKSDHINFTQINCDSWVELPVELIESAEQVGNRTCKDHSHPVVQIKLKQTDDQLGNILMALLSQILENSKSSMQDIPNLQMNRSLMPLRRRPGGSGGGTSPCLYYSCGTCSDGSVMLCTDVLGCPPDLCSDIFLPTLSANRRNNIFY
jgi:hypothetical protein